MQRIDVPTTEQVESYIERRIAGAPAPKASGCLERPLAFGQTALWRAVVFLAGLACICFASAASAQSAAAPRPRDRAEAYRGHTRLAEDRDPQGHRGGTDGADRRP